MPIDIEGNVVANFGRRNKLSVYVNEREYYGVYYIKLTKKLNEIEGFEFKLGGLNSYDTNFDYGNVVKIFAENRLLVKGRIEDVKYETYNSIIVSGFGIATKVANTEFPLRTTFDTDPYIMVKTFLATGSYTDDSTAYTGGWAIQPGVMEKLESNIPFRVEFDNRLQAINSLTKMIEWDWWVSHGDAPYQEDYFNFVGWRGSMAPVYNINVSGTSTNCGLTSRSDNFRVLMNSVVYTGKGSGTSQIYTTYTLASNVWDRLDQRLNAYADDPVFVTLSGFPPHGIILVGKMALTYAQKTANVIYNWGWDTTGTSSDNYVHTKGTLGVLLYDGGSVARTYLTASVAAVDTTINVNSTADFTATGSIIIGKEVIPYTSKTSTYFTCVRDTSVATIHDASVVQAVPYVFQYDATKHYTKTSPQAGTIMALKGLKQSTVYDPAADTEAQIELIASNWILRNGTITYYITAKMMNYLKFLNNVEIGDNVQITDTDTGLASIYRVISYDLLFDRGAVTFNVSCSNKKITESDFVDRVVKIERMIEKSIAYSQ